VRLASFVLERQDGGSTMTLAAAAPKDITPQALAVHALVALVEAHQRAQLSTLDTLAASLGARRTELRSVLSKLHIEGYIDVLRMRPTLAGFVVGRALLGAPLRPLRKHRVPTARAA
jgi:hypothetical protein